MNIDMFIVIFVVLIVILKLWRKKKENLSEDWGFKINLYEELVKGRSI